MRKVWIEVTMADRHVELCIRDAATDMKLISLPVGRDGVMRWHPAPGEDWSVEIVGSLIHGSEYEEVKNGKIVKSTYGAIHQHTTFGA